MRLLPQTGSHGCKPQFAGVAPGFSAHEHTHLELKCGAKPTVIAYDEIT